MLPFFSGFYGNPSSVYAIAGKSKKAIADSRASVARVIGAKSDEIYFTSGGSEADNWAVKAVFEALREKGKHIITSEIEHHAILHTCEYLEREYGAEITYLKVDREGFVDPEDLEAAIRPDTILVTIMAANNEIGTIEPIRELAAIAHSHGVLFHTDAVQAFGQIPLNAEADGFDLLSASAHKLNGPKGVGMLYISKNVKIGSFLHGGAQERQRRAGTENVPGIAGFGKAAELAVERMEAKAEREEELRDHLYKLIREKITNVKLNGPAWDSDPVRRLPNNLNISVEFAAGESMLIMLDMQQICASAGSACASGSLSPSHVLKAIGLSDSLARCTLRLTLSEENTKEEMEETADALAKIVTRLRRMSPRYEAFVKGDVGSEIDGVTKI